MTAPRVGPVATTSIPIGLIDEPELPTREKMDPAKLQELAQSMKRDGQWQAIGLEQRGERYRIIFGHRRYVSAKIAELPTLRADLYPEGVDHAVVMQAGENAYREKVNPAEEGDWLKELYRTRCGEDIERLCALVGLPEDYVGKRLLLALGDQRIAAAVRDKEISMAVALQLNRITRADHRDYYLTNARTHGATEKMARFWVSQSELMTATSNAQPATDPPEEPAAPRPYAVVHRCVVCDGTEDVSEMEYVQVHKFCQKAILEPAMRIHRDRR